MSTSSPLELFYMDLFGSTSNTRICGNKYGFVIVYDFSRFTWAFYLTNKSEASTSYNHLSRKVKLSLG